MCQEQLNQFKQVMETGVRLNSFVSHDNVSGILLNWTGYKSEAPTRFVNHQRVQQSLEFVSSPCGVLSQPSSGNSWSIQSTFYPQANAFHRHRPVDTAVSIKPSQVFLDPMAIAINAIDFSEGLSSQLDYQLARSIHTAPCFTREGMYLPLGGVIGTKGRRHGDPDDDKRKHCKEDKTR